MKLFAVLYLSGQIALSVGPFTDDKIAFSECKQLATLLITECKEEEGMMFSCSEMSVACEFHPERPEPNPEAADRLLGLD